MDLHAGQIQGFFSRPVDHMTAMPVLTQYVQDQLAGDDLVIIAPDAGRVKLVRKFAQKVGAPYALLEKERPAQQVAEIGYVIGDVKGKVRRDRRRHHRHRRHARRLAPRPCSTRARSRCTPSPPTASSPATRSTCSRRRRCPGIVVTDTVPLRAGAPDSIRVLTTADILTDSVRRIFTDDSVSEIFQGENQLF